MAGSIGAVSGMTRSGYGRAMVRTYPEGVPCWIDTEQADLPAAQHFYGELFGWTFEPATPPDAPVPYVIARLDGRDVAGLAAGDERGVAWNTYIAVDDADAAAERVRAAGGHLDADPADAGEGGRSALCRDPAGTPFRLWQARRRPGAQAVNEPGAWNFSDLHCEDAATVTAFYTEAFGWQVEQAAFGTMLRVPGYGDHLEATIDPDIRVRQQGVSAPPGFEDAIGWLAPGEPVLPPHWHVTFTVADRDGCADTAERLGARVLDVETTDWTREALIRDPQGALFTASQFAPTS